MRIGRRGTLLGLTVSFWSSQSAFAVTRAPTRKRLVVVILRGALDGMAAVVPYADPDLIDLRGELVTASPGDHGGLLDLGGFYGLHPALAGMHDMYEAGEALIIHAVSGGYRVRSHFEAQDCLESGAEHRMNSGWLNRAVASLTANGPAGPDGEALAVGVTLPLLLRGPAQVANWAPHGFPRPTPDLYAAIAALHQDDPVTGPAIRHGLEARAFSASVLSGDSMPAAGDRGAFPALARAAGEMLAAPDGPRIAALELGGWDTHTAQLNRLSGPLRQLDTGLVLLKDALSEAWQQTAVLVMTEFGRTARVNGTKGTDHGTATVAFLLGGAIDGGKVRATWPGLGPGKLYEHRDLAPTTDLRSVAKGLLTDHLDLPVQDLETVFPGSREAEPMFGLIRA